MGDAINSDEYVPTTIPKRMAKMKPRRTSPPKKKITRSTTIVVIEVLKVRLKVAFNA
jgi:hypothetical protein